MACGPLLWARYLSGDWKTGLARGLLAAFASIIALIAAYILWGFLPDVWWMKDLDQGLEGLLVGMYACCPALVLLTARNRSVKYLSPHTAIGIAISLGLAFTSGLIWRGSTPTGLENTLTLLWQIPPAVWSTLALFHSFGTRRAALWKIGVWVLVEGFTYALPFALQSTWLSPAT